MANPSWMTDEDAGIHEVQIASGGLFIALISQEIGKPSIGVALSPIEIIECLRDASAFDAWIRGGAQTLGSKVIFRLIGSEKEFSKFVTRLERFGYAAGKHIPVPAGSSLALQFLPTEGRVRMPKGVTDSSIGMAPIVTVSAKSRTKVLVVDDSETIRKILSKIFNQDPDIECVATVDRPSRVEEAIRTYKPDVVTLDIHMPEMDGVTLLKQLLKKCSIPMVMISALSKEDGTSVLDALEAGAVDYIQKPSMAEIADQAPVICEKIKSAALARVTSKQGLPLTESAPLPLLSDQGVDTSYLIGIGSSTGGTEALKAVLTRLPAKIPPIVIVQHIPPVFSKAFADRMNTLCPFEVKEAVDGESVTEGKVLVAPGGRQMRVVLRGGELMVLIEDTEPVNRHKPSVDVLFDSIAALGRKKISAAILTGMGADGARGLLKLRQGGARTFGQDEATCVVYGMPREAARLGGVETVLPIQKIAAGLLDSCQMTKKSRVA